MVHARSRSRAVTAFVMIVLCIGASAAACAEQKRANGDECIKNEECASLICASMKCVAPPPLMEGSGTTSPGTDAGSGGSGADSASPADSATGGNDASDDGPPVDQDGSDQDGSDQDSAADALLDVQDTSDAPDTSLADATNVFDASSGEGGEDGAALSDASDASSAGDAFDGALFDAAIDVNVDANIPDVLGG